MPVLLAEHTVTLEFADLYRRRPIERPTAPPKRSKGYHQSGILREIAIGIGELKAGEQLEEDMPWIMAIGQMWEEFAASMQPDMVWQPGEMTVDGISVNCDGITADIELTDNCFTTIEEFKATYKTVRSGEKMLQEWMWMHQGRAYCYCYGARVVRWHVMFVKGDWTDKSAPFGPVVKQYVVMFTDREVEQTWRMLVKNKGRARPE